MSELGAKVGKSGLLGLLLVVDYITAQQQPLAKTLNKEAAERLIKKGEEFAIEHEVPFDLNLDPERPLPAVFSMLPGLSVEAGMLLYVLSGAPDAHGEPMLNAEVGDEEVQNPKRRRTADAAHAKHSKARLIPAKHRPMSDYFEDDDENVDLEGDALSIRY